MKKIIFSTTHFNNIENGPALFANLLFEETKHINNIDLRILTEDIEENNTEIKLYKLNLKQNIMNRFFYQLFRIRMYRDRAVEIAKYFSYDVLIYNNAFTGFLSAKASLTPVIVMLNDYNKLNFNNKRIRFNKAYFKNYVLQKLEKIAATKSSLVIVNSKFLMNLVIETYKIPKPKIKVLYKGINIKNYQYRLREKISSNINILFIKGEFVNGGLYDLVDAISKLKNRDIKLTVIGPREIDLPKLKKYFKEKTISNFELLGPTKPEQLKKYFNKADIFCVPSHKEALGVANMEALASGIPVISTNVGGIPEVLDYGKCGWLVEPGDSSQLVEAINECIDNPKMRIKKSDYGYNFVQKFNSKNVISNFLKIIDTVK